MSTLVAPSERPRARAISRLSMPSAKRMISASRRSSGNWRTPASTRLSSSRPSTSCSVVCGALSEAESSIGEEGLRGRASTLPSDPPPSLARAPPPALFFFWGGARGGGGGLAPLLPGARPRGPPAEPLPLQAHAGPDTLGDGTGEGGRGALGARKAQ